VDGGDIVVDVEFVPPLREIPVVVVTIMTVGSVPSVEHRSVVSTLLFADKDDDVVFFDGGFVLPVPVSSLLLFPVREIRMVVPLVGG
jgi:hypothetical protein